MVTSLQEWRDRRVAPLCNADWKVVEIARADGPGSMNPDGILARLTRDLFGVAVIRGLANKKLETLRRFSVRAWFWNVIRNEDMHALLEAGYTRRHALEILSHVGMARGFTPAIQDDRAPRLSRRSSAYSHCA